jgi:hypothetical protein
LHIQFAQSTVVWASSEQAVFSTAVDSTAADCSRELGDTHQPEAVIKALQLKKSSSG